jgi:hypothetical protein
MNANQWIAWEGGVNLIAKTSAKLDSPNIIFHAAQQVHTPVGSAALGMFLWQPDPAAPPVRFGFVSTVPKVSAYLSDEIFAGTPFHGAPNLSGTVDTVIADGRATARLEIPGYNVQITLEDLSLANLVQRPPTPTAPFHQHLLEAVAGQATLTVNDETMEIVVSGSGIMGGPSAFTAPLGLYTR